MGACSGMDKDAIVPKDMLARFVGVLRDQFPRLLPASTALLRADTATVLTFACRTDGIVFFAHGAELVLGGRAQIVDYRELFCGACRIVHTRDRDARRYVCTHLSRDERVSRTLAWMVEAIGSAHKAQNKQDA